jgi:O-antigen/teichoic acid export membrane protein
MRSRNLIVQSFITKNSFGIALSQLFGPIANFISIALVIRILGPESSNTFMLLYVSAIFAAGLSDFGLRNTVFIESGRKKNYELFDYAGKIYSLRLLMGTLVLFAFSGYAIYSLEQPIILSFLFGLIAANVYFADPGLQILRGRSLASYEVFLFTLENGGVFIILSIIYFSHLGSLLSVTLAYVVMSLVRFGVVYQLIISRIGKFRFHFVGPDIAKIIKRNFSAGLSLLLMLFMLRLPVIIGPYIGIYNHIAKISIILMILQKIQILPTILSFVILPSVFQKNPERSAINKAITPMSWINLLGGFIVIIFLYFFSSKILYLFGREYVHIADLLIMVSLTIPILTLNQMLRQVAIARDVTNRLNVCLAFGVIFSIILLVVLTNLDSWKGAIYSYAIAQIVLLMLFMTFLWRSLVK